MCDVYWSLLHSGSSSIISHILEMYMTFIIVPCYLFIYLLTYLFFNFKLLFITVLKCKETVHFN